MKKILTTSEVVSCLSLKNSSWELLALGEADYDESRLELVVRLSTQLRPIARHAKGAVPELDWLPPAWTQREPVALEEAYAAAKEIFSSWSHRLSKLVRDYEEAPMARLTVNT